MHGTLFGLVLPLALLQATPLPKALEASCDRGYSANCGRLALLYEQGSNGLKKDSFRAAALYKRACDADHVPSCVKLGVLYRLGTEGPPEEGKAATAFDKACKLGSGEGCVLLGHLYDDGIPMEHDADMAFRLYERGCDLGWSMGCADAACLLLDSEGKLDPTRADLFLQKARTGGVIAPCEPVKWHASVRGEVNLLNQGDRFSGAIALSGELSRGYWAAVLTALINKTPGFRLEGRLYFLELGPFRSFVGGGVAAGVDPGYYTSVGLRGAFGVDIRFERLRVSLDVGYENPFDPFLLRQDGTFKPYEGGYLLLALGAGWSF